jgi:DNA end-binding protein Ku
MAPRAYWKGYLKLSLVSCPIALFPATSEREKISFHQLNKKTGHRVKYRKVDAESGDEVDSADIIKGYEVGKGDYIELDPEELEAVAIESKRTIDIDEFVPKDEIDELYQQPLLHCARRRGRSAGIRGHPGGHPQGGHGSDRQGRVHVARAHHRA